MGIPLQIIDPATVDWDDRVTGMMWRDDRYDENGRECWWIVLPNDHPDLGTSGHPSRLVWLTTEKAHDGSGMWNVEGTPPIITVTPSIDILRYVKQGDEWVREGSYWHGFITNGEVV
jgi:hypothetical protein